MSAVSTFSGAADKRHGLNAPSIAHGALIAICFALLLPLVGCSSTPKHAAAVREVDDKQRPGTAPVAPPARSGRAGAYYQDDGPGDNPPPNLDQIADAEPKVERLARAANNPYSVFGQQYVPYKTFSSYRQRGIGSWYGRKFHGQRTSSGEPYDMYAMSAAHTILPIPSYARVTNIANGRSVIVRVNDRGPFHSGRIIDLSYAAAYRLGYAASGSAMVEVEAILPEDIPAIAARRKEAPQVASVTTVPSAAPAAPEVAQTAAAIPVDTISGGIYLQLGAFSARDNAENFRARIYQQLAWLNDAIRIFARDGMFRLDLGPYRDRDEAASMAQKISGALQLKPIIVVR